MSSHAQALIQRKILDELEKGKFLGKYWYEKSRFINSLTLFLRGPIFFKQKRSREYVCALIMFERIAAQASRSEFRGSPVNCRYIIIFIIFRVKFAQYVCHLGATVLPALVARRRSFPLCRSADFKALLLVFFLNSFNFILADPWKKHRMQQKLMNYLWQDIESGILETLVRAIPKYSVDSISELCVLTVFF